MLERGTVADVTEKRGKINPDQGNGEQVKFTIGVVDGPRKQLRTGEAVLFLRENPGGAIASWVRPVTGDEATLAIRLEAAFPKEFRASRLDAAARSKVSRMSAERAALILSPVPGTDRVPDTILEARMALAIAAMALMATEAVHSSEHGKITAKSLGDVLRRQRPRLPR